MTGKYDVSEIDETLNPDFPVSTDAEAGRARIRQAIQLGGTIDEVARKSGVPKGTLENLLRGSGVRYPVIFALARATGVSLDWLATGKGPVISDAQAKLLSTQDHVVRTAAYEALIREHPELAPRTYPTREAAELAMKEALSQASSDAKNPVEHNENDSQTHSNSGTLSREEAGNLKSKLKSGEPSMIAVTPMTKDLLSLAVRLVRRFYGEDFHKADPDAVADKITDAYDILAGKKS